jgi:uncharacterized membrane protein
MASTTELFSNVIDRNRPDARRQRRDLSRQGAGEHTNVGSGERIASALAGGLLAMWGLRRKGSLGYGAAAIGAELLYRGVSGHCHAYTAMGVTTKEQRTRGQPVDVNHALSVDVRHSVHIARPREELFAIWRDFSTLPQFMDHLERVEVLSPTESKWVAKGPAGMSVEWNAEIVDERPGEWIAWRAVEPAQVPNNGTVMFRESPDGGTEVFVTLEAQPPAGKLGDLVARMFGRSPEQEVRASLDRFKEMAESQHDFGQRLHPSGDREVGIAQSGLSDLPPRQASAVSPSVAQPKRTSKDPSSSASSKGYSGFGGGDERTQQQSE